MPSIHSGNTLPSFESDDITFNVRDPVTSDILNSFTVVPVTTHLILLSFNVGVTIESFEVVFTNFVTGTTVQGLFLLQSDPCISLASCNQSCVKIDGSAIDYVGTLAFNYDMSPYNDYKSITYPAACDGAYVLTGSTDDVTGMASAVPYTASATEMWARVILDIQESVTFAASQSFVIEHKLFDAT